MKNLRADTSDIHATTEDCGGLRSSLRASLGQTAVGVASALMAATPAGAQQSELPQITVQGPQEPQVAPQAQSAPADDGSGDNRPGGLPGGGPGGGYVTGSPGVGRIPTDLLDTPQTVNVVPERVMEEQNATSLRDALRNVSGITISAGEGGRQGDTFVIRGFSGQNDVFRDGVRDLGWFTRDVFNIEAVEAYFGPSSVTFGRGSTGGIINLVTKTPKDYDFGTAQFSASTDPGGRAEIDVNRVISPDVSVRLNAMVQEFDVTDRDAVENGRWGIAPSMKIDLTDRTTLTLDYMYQGEDSIPDYGHPYVNFYPVSTSLGVGRDVFYGVPDADTEEVDAHIATARLEHEISDNWTFLNTLRYGQVDRFASPTAPRGVDLAALDLNRQRFQTSTDNENLVNQTDLRGEFMTGGLKHKANIGMEVSRETRDQLRNNINGTPRADLFAPNLQPDLSGTSLVFSNSSNTTQENLAFYAADQIELNRWFEVLGSVRFDQFDTVYDRIGGATAGHFERQDDIFSWRAGAVFHPQADASVYFMYGTSANPSAELGSLSPENVLLDPEENETYEIGAKKELAGGNLVLSTAIFRINKKNARVDTGDPALPPVVLAGKQRVDGFYAGLTGQLTPYWQMFLSYTYLDSIYLESPFNPLLEGQALPNAPKNSFALWTTYDISDRITIGGGAVYQSETPVNNPATGGPQNKVPSYWRFDLMGLYELTDRVALQLNVYNLTDELYYDQFYGGHAVPARGRTALLTTRIKF